MSELIKNKASVSMTPLVEHVYSKWHFGRVTTVGDSCHKVSCILWLQSVASRLTEDDSFIRLVAMEAMTPSKLALH